MLFRYLIRTISIGIGHPKFRSMRFTALIPAVLAPLRSMTILRGRPFTSRARAKNLVAAGLVVWLGSAWPDLIVAFGIAGLFLHSSWSIIRDARSDLEAAA